MQPHPTGPGRTGAGTRTRAAALTCLYMLTSQATPAVPSAHAEEVCWRTGFGPVAATPGFAYELTNTCDRTIIERVVLTQPAYLNGRDTECKIIPAHSDRAYYSEYLGTHFTAEQCKEGQIPIEAHPSPRPGTDTGTCAARTILDSADNGRSLYVARNTCATPIHLKLVAQGQHIYCQPVQPGAYVAWSTIYFDHNWTVENCDKKK